MKSVRRNVCSYSNGGGGASASSVKGEVIIYSGLNRQGVWSVARRSAVLRLWDIKTGELKASFNVRNILKGEFNEITALVVRGHAVWLGTRSGYLFLLDASAIENQEQETAIKGFQYCGDGRVKGITPFPSSLKVLCSIEYSDEVSGCIMVWEYQSTSSKTQALISPTQSLQPVNKYRIESEFLCDS
ncbi:PREDICTED: uncharacterized protein LOC100636182 [Amphimedon queenslandica]|nr:PREDICTED: uncharacterized protein LOC100636182 [Amphimedon queenslandica]|eukprot:XP_003391989.2 PREDICTED: uncharacterized protein LOC100636182 [Amphimedon queenslandica]